MENGEVVLEVGREELALDRPPTATLSSSPKISKKILQNPEEGSNIEESLNVEQSLSDEDGDQNAISNSTTATVENVEDDYDAIETNEFEMVQAKYDNNTDDGETDILSDTVNATATDILNSKINNDNNTIRTDKVKQVKYFHGKPLTSCLKTVSCVEDIGESNKPKKSVHYFGNEESCVKEYIEPVDPWRDVRTPSKAEVISFYRNSCQKLRCKPIDKVFKQIQDAPELSGRAGTLILRGSRLDSRSCEALESVFRRVQFENLDLENCSMEEDGATALLEMIEFYHSTCKLNIACNPKIGMRGWQALCRMLRKTPCLTYLDARRTLLTDMTMPTFGRCLKADPPLKILHLEGVFLSGRPMLILTTAMKYNKVLEELYLGDNDLSSSDGPPIGAMLTYNTTLQLLDLRNNQIKDIGLAHIGNGLSDQSELCQGGLCSLILWNNGLTHEGMGYLSDGLVQTNSLKALNLGQNRIGDLGIQKLKIGLIKNKSLHKLGFLNTKLGSEGAVALAEVLADSLTITRIDIRENNIQTAGLMAFAMALKVNNSLLRLDLDKDIRKEVGMEQVMQSVLVDIYNFCHRNKQIARQQFQGSTSSAEQPAGISAGMSRQSSSSSECNDSHIVTDDIFHPETGKEDLMPFSPVYTDPKELPLNFSSYTNKEEYTSLVNSSSQLASPPVDISKSTQKEILNAISSDAQGLPKDGQSVHILNKPTLDSSDRRASRFSVTKILDSLGTHAAGVANKLVNATTTSVENAKVKKHPVASKGKTPIDTELVHIPSNEPTDRDEVDSTAITDTVQDTVDSSSQLLDNSRTESTTTSSDGTNIESQNSECNENIDNLELDTQGNQGVQDESSSAPVEENIQSLEGERSDTEPTCERSNEASQSPQHLSTVKEFSNTDSQISKEDKEMFILQAGDSEYRNNLIPNHPIPVDLPS